MAVTQSEYRIVVRNHSAQWLQGEPPTTRPVVVVDGVECAHQLGSRWVDNSSVQYCSLMACGMWGAHSIHGQLGMNAITVKGQTKR